MRFANILFFLVASALGIVLSVSAVWNLPFGIFTVTDDKFKGAIDFLKSSNGGGGFDGYKFYAIEALADVAAWGGMINFVAATICALLAVLPALATIHVIERKLFDRRVDRGWKTIAWLAVLGALAVGIYPAPMWGTLYVILCAIVISAYIVTYQWPKSHKSQTKDTLQMPPLKESRQWSHRRIAGDQPQA